MKIWKLRQTFAGRYRPIVESSPLAYGGFDFCARPSAAAGIEVLAGCAEAERWLPSIRAGVQQGCGSLAEPGPWDGDEPEGEAFEGVTIEITAIHAHPHDTSERVMAARASAFVGELRRPPWRAHFQGRDA